MNPLDTQVIIVCNNNGKPTGEYISKSQGHEGGGKRHLAITVLIYNDKGEVLLQKRKHKVFDDIWDLTGATHPLHLENGLNESFEEASKRCLKREYDISEVRLENLGTFNYFAQDGNLCENEHCAILITEYNGIIKLNPEVGYGYKWLDKREFLKDISKNPNDYSRWAQESVKILKEKEFFEATLL